MNLSFLGIFNFTAPYLPWVLLAFSVTLRSNAAVDLLGIVAGAYPVLLKCLPFCGGSTDLPSKDHMCINGCRHVLLLHQHRKASPQGNSKLHFRPAYETANIVLLSKLVSRVGTCGFH